VATKLPLENRAVKIVESPAADCLISLKFGTEFDHVLIYANV